MVNEVRYFFQRDAEDRQRSETTVSVLYARM